MKVVVYFERYLFALLLICIISKKNKWVKNISKTTVEQEKSLQQNILFLYNDENRPVQNWQKPGWKHWNRTLDHKWDAKASKGMLGVQLTDFAM